MTPLTPAEICKALLMGKHVFAAQNEPVGCVTDVEGNGPEARIFVDLGGMLCLDGKTILLLAQDMTIGREENGEILLQAHYSAHALEGMPAVMR